MTKFRKGLFTQLGHTKRCVGLLIRQGLLQRSIEQHDSGADSALHELPVCSGRSVRAVVRRDGVRVPPHRQS